MTDLSTSAGAPSSAGRASEPLEAPLSDLVAGNFVRRHVGPAEDEVERMLAAVGRDSLESLLADAVPAGIRASGPLQLPAAVSEASALAELRSLAARNHVTTSLIGMGYFGTYTPSVILRTVLENPAWYTAYTPYQPEISQGRLEALINFQTVVADLTGLPVAGASLLDEATAAAEAMTLARRKTTVAGDFLVDADTHPQTVAVLRTRAEPLGLTVRTVCLDDPGALTGDYFGVLVSYPGSSGQVRDLRELVAAAHEQGALVVAATDLLACTVLTPPGEWGADIAVGSAQRFGVPMGFGGPHAGFLSVRSGLERSLPGRLVGASVDADGHTAYRLALQTREQHIRREKATSNICTAQVLLAVMAGMYAVYHGPEGLARIAARTHRMAALVVDGLRAANIEVSTSHFFDTVTVRVPGRADEVLAAARDRGLTLRRVDADTVGISCDETTGTGEVAAVLSAFGAPTDVAALAATGGPRLPDGLRRTSAYLTHPTFARYRSETEMLRYLTRLAHKDFALDRGMIPLGSCTMKLNAATEMEPVTWPEFGGLHPFAPIADSEGYRSMFGDLERWLCEITGYDAVSLQPNAGSQGELAGLLAIRAYHRATGGAERDVCLIPSSAHGTNAASAVMAGMRVVVVACRDNGDVDLADLRAKVDEHADRLAAIMVTYPSTHGVFEAGIGELCAVVHDAGGQVYVDGANLNALVGVARPGRFGADVSHLNLHKTFCIPHGGGGPGVGPIGVREHLAPFLPNHPLVPEAGPATGPGPVSAAPWGSASILPISWAYVRMMGGEGLTRATEVAVLSANYLATRLAPHYPVLYSGENGLVAHECILDLRPLTAETGVTVDDVAKRLIDHGFHAPTMSFPVAGTLMIEPTESESLAELDRFCDAMIAIRAEIDAVRDGMWPVADSPLRQAPHPAAHLAGEWNHPYSREVAAYPSGVTASKYWPPVRRIDGAFGDRNLVCACPPLSEYDS